MTILGILAGIVGTIMGLANIPQAIKIFNRKSAKDISPITYGVLSFGALVWVAYGIEQKDIPILFTNAIGFICLSSVLFGWFLYGRKRR